MIETSRLSRRQQPLNTFLLDHGITPIFLKGAANLITGLYSDIAERMVGDIDFIFSKQDYPKAIQLFKRKWIRRGCKSLLLFPKPTPLQKAS